MTHGQKKHKPDCTGHKVGPALAVKAAGDPSTEQLGRINEFALSELTAEQVYTRTAILAHNAIDRDQDVFDGALLRDFAATLPGKGLFIKHPRSFDGDTGPGVGRWFEAKVTQMSLDQARALLKQPNLQWPPGTDTAELLEASYYIPRSEKNASLITDIDAGVASDVSIGFRAADATGIQDGEGRTVAYRLQAPGEALEGSLVWLGAQPGARTIKHHNPETEGDDVDKDAQIKTLQDENTALQQKADAAKAATGALDAIRKAVGDDLADNPDKLARAVKDGQGYRTELIDQVVTGERQMKMVADDEASVDAAKAMYAETDIDMLKARAKAVRGKTTGGAGVDGGDPNAGNGTEAARQEQDRGGEKDYSNPAENPAIAG